MRWTLVLQLCLTVVLLWRPGATVFAGETDTLAAIRADLQAGSLRPLLSRQSIIHLPQSIFDKWVADIHFQSFAVTGFNENDRRFAVRVRLHLSEGEGSEQRASVAFLRIGGIPGTNYTVDQFYDYTTGLDLVELQSQKAWLTSEAGEAFMTSLSRDPGSRSLARLAEGKAAPLSLWLAQCSGLPCEPLALGEQVAGKHPALWQLQRAFAEDDKTGVESHLDALRAALGDDPWLWQITGIYARQHQHCSWVTQSLQDAWQQQPNHRQLADSALQCTLTLISPDLDTLDANGTVFLDRLSEVIGASNLSKAISRYYHQQKRERPDTLTPWMTTTRE